ncbi:family 20 glycosylhydrolase [Halosimplex amylolyticum]|uniref:family 20 glycosylhydrolase n=1 Tax=Halosimplex amylolyticum TaxID=3396616 RepID=UPI003F56613D
MESTEPRVLPRPRTLDSRDGSITIDTPLAIGASDDEANAVRSRLETLFERETNESVVADDDPTVRLVVDADRSADAVDDPEGYVLDADGDAETVTIRAPTADGLRHGCQTFVTGLDRRDGGWAFPACEIRDWPETRWRGFMLDPARGFLPVDRVKRRIDQAARAKMNRLHLHLLDDEGYALESAAFPELNEGADGEPLPAYSAGDVAEIVDYAAERGIEVVPEIDLPSHAEHVLARFPELRCTVPNGEASERTLCIGSDETFAFVETLLDEVIELFPFETVHVGGDEWEMHGHSWDDCVDCEARMDAIDAETVTEHFYGFVRHVHGFLDERDRRTTLWNDQIDVSESPDLPRDVRIQFWRVAAPGRGPIEGCSMERFLEAGFDVVNSYVHAAYVNGWISEEYMQGWAPRRRPSVPDEHTGQVRGGELLAWEPSDDVAREYFERALPSAIPLFGDRLWNPEPIDGGGALRRALTRHALGPYVPDGFDVYRELGGTIVPTDWRRDSPSPPAHANRSLGDRSPADAEADYRSAIETLDSLRDAGEAVFPETADAYRRCLEWLVEVADRERRGVLDRPGEW